MACWEPGSNMMHGDFQEARDAPEDVPRQDADFFLLMKVCIQRRGSDLEKTDRE